MATIEDLFSNVVIDRVISTLRGADYRMANVYGLLPGQSNVDEVPGRKFAWDRFDNTRLVAQGRTPGSAAANVALNPVGTVLATAYRMFEQTALDYERVFRNRGLGASMGDVDPRGERYIAKQMTHKLRRFMNAREFMVVRMLVDGGFNLKVTGNDVIPTVFNAAATDEVIIDFQHPAANNLEAIADLNGAVWSTATTPIINDLIAINDRSEKDSRYPIKICWCTSGVWQNIINNDQVKAIGGTANTVFNEQGFVPTMSREGEGQTPGIGFVLRGFPQLQFFVYGDRFQTDDQVAGNTFTDHIPAGFAIFTPAPSGEWLEWRAGSELVQKREGGPIEEQFGFGMWQEVNRNPLSLAMFALDNGLPAPYVPNSWFIVNTEA